MSENTVEQTTRYCLYARKSTESDELQAMSIESQINEMQRIAVKENLQVIDIRTESKSAKVAGKRPILDSVINDVKVGHFEGILTWAPDRLSRNAGDLGRLVDLMDSGHLQHIRTHGQKFTNNPNEKFLLMILCSQAKLENDNRSKNVMRGIRAMAEKGKRPGPPPLGYKLWRDPEKLTSQSVVIIDEERAPLVKKMFEYVAQDGMSGRDVMAQMTKEGLTTKKGGGLNLSTIYRMLKEPFYYGEFEYPKRSGTWYKGTYKSLITKKLFAKVQNQLKTYVKSKWGAKTFYFTRMFKCSQCGSGLSGEEKIKPSGKRYVYYKCNRYGGKKFCHQKYIREEKLIEELAQLVNLITMKDLILNTRLQKKVKDMNAMYKMTGGTKKVTALDYIRYVLTEGEGREKSHVCSCLKGQLFLENGEVKFTPEAD